MEQRAIATKEINRLAIVVFSSAQAGPLTRQLREVGFYFTQISSFGSWLEEVTTCLLIGVAEARLSALVALIRKYCPVCWQYIAAGAAPNGPSMAIQAESGGAVVYVMAVERFVQL